MQTFHFDAKSIKISNSSSFEKFLLPVIKKLIQISAATDYKDPESSVQLAHDKQIMKEVQQLVEKKKS